MNEEKDNMEGNYCRPRNRRWMYFIPFFVIAAIIFFGWVVMALWNAVIPHVFTTVGTVTYVQAIGILILSKILFGGFRGRGYGRGGNWGGRGKVWKEKWMNMSEEERAKFKEEWKNRCC